jgi:hypothetical protein
MELTRKGKILRIYGRNLADEFQSKEELSEGRISLDFSLMAQREMYDEIYSKLAEVSRDFSSDDSQKIANYFAEKLFEMGHLNFAYSIYKTIDSKNAKVMEKTFPKQMLELVVRSKDNRVFPIVKGE